MRLPAQRAQNSRFGPHDGLQELRRKILSSADHRVIGLQYALTSLIFLFIAPG